MYTSNLVSGFVQRWTSTRKHFYCQISGSVGGEYEYVTLNTIAGILPDITFGLYFGYTRSKQTSYFGSVSLRTLSAES
jgi:hypothetical protein